MLMQVAGEAARARGTALVLFVDEMQYLDERQLAALIVALHCAARLRLQILRLTQGYPYSLQEWGSACWRVAAGPDITLADVKAATPVAVRELDSMFFRVRLERTTPFERRYLRAMA